MAAGRRVAAAEEPVPDDGSEPTATVEEPTMTTWSAPAVVDAPKLDLQVLFRSAVESGSGVDTIKELYALWQEMKADAAREAWNKAMADFQATCPEILKDKEGEIPTSSGSFSWTYASLEQIKRTIDPYLTRYGLAATWRTMLPAPQNAISMECIIRHVLGHSETSGVVSVPVQTQSTNRAIDPAKSVMIAMSYAKRATLWLAIGKTADEDDEKAIASDREKKRAQRRMARAERDADGPVRQPQRKVEAGPSPKSAPPPQQAGPPPQDAPKAEGKLIWRGKIANVTHEPTGTGKQEVYRLWCPNEDAEDGTSIFQTLSAPLADAARAVMNTEVEIEWRQTGKGGRQAVAIYPVIEGAPPAAAEK